MFRATEGGFEEFVEVMSFLDCGEVVCWCEGGDRGDFSEKDRSGVFG